MARVARTPLRHRVEASYPSLRTDLINVGASWVDEPVVHSNAAGWTLITSRDPGDLPDFIDDRRGIRRAHILNRAARARDRGLRPVRPFAARGGMATVAA